MRLIIHVKPGSRRNIVRKNALTNGLIVETTARAKDGEANSAVLKLLAQYFKIAPSRVRILKGSKTRKKLVELAYYENPIRKRA